MWGGGPLTIEADLPQSAPCCMRSTGKHGEGGGRDRVTSGVSWEYCDCYKYNHKEGRARLLRETSGAQPCCSTHRLRGNITLAVSWVPLSTMG